MFCQQGPSSLGGLIGGCGIFQRRAHSCVHGDVVTLNAWTSLGVFSASICLCIVPDFCYSPLGLETLSAPCSELLGII